MNGIDLLIPLIAADPAKFLAICESLIELCKANPNLLLEIVKSFKKPVA